MIFQATKSGPKLRRKKREKKGERAEKLAKLTWLKTWLKCCWLESKLATKILSSKDVHSLLGIRAAQRESASERGR
jgi:hypothetical protein